MANTEGWRRDRKSRKRGGGSDRDFPEDIGGWSPPPSPPPQRRPSFGTPAPSAAAGPEIGAVVKWFNPEKGFGFVELTDGSGDAFLHASVLERAGAGVVGPGATLRVRVGPGQKGLQVAEVLEVADAAGGAPPPTPPGEGRQAPRGGPPPSGGEEVRGTVKWYNAAKGFGFVAPEGGGRDVFVHASALERGGLPPLTEGQVVTMRVVQGKKGPEVASIVAA